METLNRTSTPEIEKTIEQLDDELMQDVAVQGLVTAFETLAITPSKKDIVGVPESAFTGYQSEGASVDTDK
jgi:hypothetical protein